MNRRVTSLLIILLVAGSLAACGRKNALEPPPVSAVTIPGAPISV